MRYIAGRSRTRLTMIFAGLSVGSLVAASAAYAGSLDTGASLSTAASTPSVVSVGDNSFTIYVSAIGNAPSTQQDTATIVTRYTMAADGTITASSAPADQTTLTFASYNYSGCPSANPPQGCAANPFVVTADLVVAAGTPGGTSGTLTVANTGSNGLSTDGTPAMGFVQVAASNHAPSMPGAPTLDAGSTTPNNSGDFTVDWAASTDEDAGDSVTYTLQKRDADDPDWTTVASGLSANSYTFDGEAEGSWRYQVQAADDHGATSAFATDAAPIVVVDETAPNAPTSSTVPATAAYVDGSGNDWYADSVTVSFAANGDPVLADTSAGSGVASVSADGTFDSGNVNADGSFSVTGYATDNAGNQSAGTTVDGYVDWQAPTVHVTCPATTVLLHATTSAPWTAADLGSGLATAASGSVPLDTSAVGSHTATVPAGTATDNVGHTSDAATCTYNVGYAFSGFLQPINDTAHFVGATTSIFKAGSTVPVKFQLTDANGVPVQAAGSAPSWLTPIKGAALPSSATVDESTYSASASSGLNYRWDATSQQYIFNWNTAKNQSGSYWRIGVSLDDGSSYYVSIGLK